MTSQKQQETFSLIMKNLPDEFKHRASEIRTRDSLSCFDKGDFVNDVYRWCLTNKIEISIQTACNIAAYLLQTEQGAFRLYDFAQLALTFRSEKARKRYSVLPVSHLEFACQYDTTTRNAILEWDLEELGHNGGRPVSRSKLVERFDPERKRMIEAEVDQIEEGIPDPQDTTGMEVYGLETDLPQLVPSLIELEEDAHRLFRAALVLSQRMPAIAKMATQVMELCNQIAQRVQTEREEQSQHKS